MASYLAWYQCRYYHTWKQQLCTTRQKAATTNIHSSIIYQASYHTSRSTMNYNEINSGVSGSWHNRVRLNGLEKANIGPITPTQHIKPQIFTSPNHVGVFLDTQATPWSSTKLNVAFQSFCSPQGCREQIQRDRITQDFPQWFERIRDFS